MRQQPTPSIQCKITQMKKNNVTAVALSDGGQLKNRECLPEKVRTTVIP